MRGITSKLALSLLFIVSTVLIAFGYADYRKNDTRLTEDLQRDIKIVRSRLETSLPVPIWNFDTGVIEKILQSEIPQIFIAGIKVLNGSDEVIAGVSLDDKGGPVFSTEFEIQHSWIDSSELYFEEEGEKTFVGKLSLYISDRHIKAILQKNLESILIQVLSTDLIILILFYFVLKPIVGPLKYLNEVAGKIAAGDYSADVERKSRDEVGDLSESFNTMRLTIRKKMGDLASINSIGEQLTLTYDRNMALGIVLERLSEHARFENGSIFLCDNKTQEYSLHGYYPERSEKPLPRSFKLGEGIVGLAISEGQAIFVPDTKQDSRFLGAGDGEARTLLCVPMFDGDQIIGAINFSGRLGEVKYSEGDEEFMTSISRSLVITLKNIEMREEIEEHNRNLEIKVQERTAALQSKTNDISAMMRNLQQGLFTILAEMSIHHEYSKFLETIFETEQIANRPFMDLLLADVDLSEDEKDQIKVAISSMIGSDEMMWEFNAHLLPHELVRTRGEAKQIFEVDWNPIVSNEEIEKVMVTVRDVTELRRLQLEAMEQKKDLDIISQILNIESGKFDDFITNAKMYVSKNRELIESSASVNKELLQVLFRNMHTIKGNSRTYGLSYITECAHLAEAAYDTLRKADEPEWMPESLLQDLNAVETEIEHYLRIAHDKLGLSADSERLKGINTDMIQSLIATLGEISNSQAIGSYKEVLRGQLKTLYGAVFDSLEDTVNDVAQSLPSLAQAVEKPAPRLLVECDEFYMSKKAKNMLNDVLMHCLRNSIDHGIEMPEERREQGKDDVGTIRVNAKMQNGSVLLSISDDGRGLALEKIRQKAIEQGLIESGSNLENSEVAELVFHSGLSTAEKVSQISGRGVGMDAVRNFLREQGGDIVLNLKTTERNAYVPFETQISLPEALFERVA